MPVLRNLEVIRMMKLRMINVWSEIVQVNSLNLDLIAFLVLAQIPMIVVKKIDLRC